MAQRERNTTSLEGNELGAKVLTEKLKMFSLNLANCRPQVKENEFGPGGGGARL